MASFVATASQVFAGAVDLTGRTRTIGFGPVTRAMQDATTMADGGYTVVVPGLISGSVDLGLLDDFAAGNVDDVFGLAGLGSQFPVSLAPNPTGTLTAGDPAWFTRAVQGSADKGGTKGEMAGTSITFGTDTAVVQGYVAHPLAARTSTGTGTAVALGGPTASQSLYAALHVTAYSGLTNVVFKIQSDDNSNFTSATDRITFTTVTGTTSEWKAVAGSFSSETHHRATWTVTGTGSVSFFAAVGVI